MLVFVLSGIFLQHLRLRWNSRLLGLSETRCCRVRRHQCAMVQTSACVDDYHKTLKVDCSKEVPLWIPSRDGTSLLLIDELSQLFLLAVAHSYEHVNTLTGILLQCQDPRKYMFGVAQPATPRASDCQSSSNSMFVSTNRPCVKMR